MTDEAIKTCRVYWDDTHHNTYMTQRQDPSIAEILLPAKAHLDFYSGAYHTPTHNPGS